MDHLGVDARNCEPASPTDQWSGQSSTPINTSVAPRGRMSLDLRRYRADARGVRRARQILVQRRQRQLATQRQFQV